MESQNVDHVTHESMFPKATPGAVTSDAQSDSRSPEPDQTDQSYNPIPPNRTFTARVRYIFRGRGQPLPYSLDDEDSK